MDQTLNFATWPSSAGGASLEMSIQSLSKNFGLIRSPNGAKAILSELEKCFAALPYIFPRISTESVELLIRMTICALQTQTTLEDDLRYIICRGATCLHDKNLAQQLWQETAPQTLAENSEWVQVLQQQNLQQFKEIDGQSYERITFCLENAAKLVEMAPEVAAVFHPLLIKPGHSVRAMVVLDTANPPETKSANSLLKLNTPSTSTKMVEEIKVPERLFTCDFCQKTFSLRRNFVQHIRYHSRGRPHKCNVCSKAFPYPSQLVKHIRTHTGKKPFVCSVCHKGFTQSINLKRHSRTHTGEKPYTCKFCQKSFSLSQTLKRHKRIHTGERPYKCNFCPKMFSQSESLVAHTRTHTGEKPFICSVCHRGFAKSCALKTHFRTHTGEKPYTCDICNKSFTRKGTLNSHKRIHTRKASDLQGSPSGPVGVPIASSASPSKQPLAEFVYNLPEQLAADMSKPGSFPANSLDMPLEERCDMSKETSLNFSTLFLLLQDLDSLSS